MPAGGGSHYADAVGIEPVRSGLAAHYPDSPLEVLPCGGVLGEGFCRAGSTVFQGDDGHALGVEVAAYGSNLESVGIVAGVGASGVDDLDGVGAALMREVPLDVGLALVLLAVGHLAFGPYILLGIACAVVIGRIPFHEVLLRGDGAEETHLGHELYRTLESEGSVALVGVEMEFGGNLHAAELPVNQRGSVRGVGVLASMMQADGACMVVELEDLADGHVRAISLAICAGAGFAVGGHIGGSVCNRPVDVAGDLVYLVDGLISGCLRTGGKHQGKMPAGRHSDYAYLFGVVSAFGSLAAHHPHCPLAIFPGTLVDGEAYGTGSAVHEVHALHTDGRKGLAPIFDKSHIAAVLV